MADITLLLEQSRGGDSEARARLLSEVYRELHSLARHRLRSDSMTGVLEAPTLVHEAYLRLMPQAELPGSNRKEFFSYAASVMRSVVIDLVRERRAQKRGDGADPLTLTNIADEIELSGPELDLLGPALDRLKRIDERAHTVTEMRYFGGLSVGEIAGVLEVSEITVKRDWQKARAFLLHQLKDGQEA